MNKRYWLESIQGFRTLIWKRHNVSSAKLADLTNEIVACLNCGDDVRVRDALRKNYIEQTELLQILGIDLPAKSTTSASVQKTV